MCVRETFLLSLVVHVCCRGGLFTANNTDQHIWFDLLKPRRQKLNSGKGVEQKAEPNESRHEEELHLHNRG